jgi:hypothetical protein
VSQYTNTAKAGRDFSVSPPWNYINHGRLVMFTIDADNVFVAQIAELLKTVHRATTYMFLAFLCIVDNVTILALNPHLSSPSLCTSSGTYSLDHRTSATSYVLGSLRRIQYTADAGEAFA